VAYLEAQPMSLLPGGEAFRTLTLRKQVNVPLAKGVPVVFLQSFTENVGLVSLALISAVILQQQVLIIFALVACYLVVLLLVRSRRTAEHSRRLLNKLPFVNLAKAKFMGFIRKNKTLLSGTSFVVLLLSGLAPTLLASLLLFIIANDLGITLTFMEAIIAYTLPTVLQNVTFLPGGIGVNEQSSVGILIILGATLPAAVALTLIVRFVTLGLGILLGLSAIALAKLHPRLES
jgi:glycosyltransferase 2 family protein